MLKLKESFLRLGRRGFAVALMFLMPATMLLAQEEMSEKYSLTTQMFLNEQKAQALQPKGGRRRAKSPQLRQNPGMPKLRRLIARPDTVGGVAYISCFIHMKDAASLGEVRSLGVEVEETFDGLDFITARVPVEQLENLAGIGGVTSINVARQMRPLTDEARRQTNTDDVLTQSTDAITQGVTSLYDGSGVVLGIIDTGIDFQHIAFKDKDGNSRIKQAYVYNGSSGREYTSVTSTSPTTDDKAEDHGTHTATTAGGSSVTVSGTTVTVTDSHASATYGGMAPGADLYLAGINGLSDTYLTNALKKMVTYADGQGKPLVVSNSWGSSWGPRDGTGEFASLVAQYFGDSHPNHIILFASSNDAGHSKDNEGGGFFVKKSSASSSSPLGTIIRSATYSNTDAGYLYQGVMAFASGTSKLGCKIHVLNSSTGAVQKSWTATSSMSSFSGLSTYYDGTLSVSILQGSGKYYLLVSSDDGLETTSTSGSSYLKSKYTLAIEVYPTSDSGDVNMWAGDYTYFTGHLTTSGHTWTAGTDDMCVSDEATIPNAISVGAYVSKNAVKNYQGTTYTYGETLGDIASFSSYATAEQSPTGEAYPWITAPGAQVVAGVNHYHTASVDDYSYFSSDNKSSLVVNNTSNPYGSMQGTSMATPVAAGIVALWLQAAQSVGKDLTVNDVKEIMAETAINDSHTTTGTNASHFGKGKIDALAGIHYILASSSVPLITASRAGIGFEAGYSPELSKTETLTVTGTSLTSDISVTLSDPSGAYSVSPSSITASEAENGAEIAVTWTPKTVGATSATLTFSSDGAEDLLVSLTGNVTVSSSYELVTDASTLSAGDKILIAYVDGSNCRVLGTTQNTNNRAATDDVTLNADGTLTPGKAAQVITLEKSGDNFLLNAGSGYLYAASSSSNYLKTRTTANANAQAAISIADGNATIKFQGTNTRNLLCYNKNNGSPIFSCYGGTSSQVLLPQVYSEASLALRNDGTVNAQTIAAYSGVTVNAALSGRTLYKDNAWNTICLPFDVTIADSPLAGADVRALSSASLADDVLTLNFTEEGAVTALSAGTPYIIKWTEGIGVANPIFKGVTVKDGIHDFVSDDGNVRFTGTYDLVSFAEEDESVLFMGSANRLYTPSAGARIGAFRSYFRIPEGSFVKHFVLNFGDDPDGIKDLRELKDLGDSWHSLDGRKLSGTPSQRGIYIQGGRKVVK